MINLFYSESYWSGSNRMNGPKKVVNNLLESLKQEGVEYSLNKEEYKYNFLIHYDYQGHIKHSNLELENCFIGPQIWFFDQHISALKENPHYYNKIIVPSQWVKNLAVNKFYFPENKIDIWAVGVKESNLNRNIKYDCLVYFKRRSQKELNEVINFLNNKSLTYNVVEYGNYLESDLELLCSQSRFCFLLNGTESQGIAVQEIMSCNVPILVWDVNCWNDQGPTWTVPATSVPYWSNECGEIFFDFEDINVTFENFYSKIDKYNPRKYVENVLSYKTSVKDLLEIFNAT